MQHLIDTILWGGTYATPVFACRAPGGLNPQIARDSAPYRVWRGENSHWGGLNGTIVLTRISRSRLRWIRRSARSITICCAGMRQRRDLGGSARDQHAA